MAAEFDSTYLFVLCPPYSGSTLLWRLIDTSDNVSALPAEGQFLPEVREVMRDEPWELEPPLPWGRIKDVWDGYWDHSNPVLVEKSPPNLIRVEEIEAHFDPVAFVVMVRNPYAHTEGLMRRNGWDAGFSAAFSIRTLRAQMENARRLEGRAVTFTYEDLVADPVAIADRIAGEIPALADMAPESEFAVHSIAGDAARGIVDFNGAKIARLSGRDLRTINETLRAADDVLRFWGYDLVEPSLAGSVTAARLRAGDRARAGYHRVRGLAGRVKRRLIG